MNNSIKWLGWVSVVLLTALLLLQGCATTGGPAAPISGRMPRVALVLGGGASRGFAHVGVLRVFEQEKIPIDLIVGTSVGSLIGAIYAANPNSFELEWLAFELEKDDIFDFSLFSSRTGPVKGDKLAKFVASHVKVKTIEEMQIPFYAVACDLNTGEPVVFERGPAELAVRASSSIPGIFTPLSYNNRLLVDGGVLGSIAPETARAKGADLVIAVNIGKAITNYDTGNVVSITLQAIDIMGNRIDRYKNKEADIVIEPEVGNVGTMDFSKKKELMLAGIEAAQKAVPVIRQAIDSFRATHPPR
ncbi:MAG TPA: patatin-like phospholipase family protein [bacterium]|nr:patatin-like phospholipase family protein [bacterium]HQG44791.1 patatin-like phospholipase family protein [bacterium]HQI48504.1 patatin-like phospholipase family protein [bacterium]HQJ63073.1 patatin-like phospholipase family protein [bacterium]